MRPKLRALPPAKSALELYSESSLPTKHATFRVLVFRERGGQEHAALVLGEVSGEEVLARVHSECLTGEAFGSLRCDCKDQLEGALERIAAQGRGVLVYLRQEGRGIGLGNKIRAYALQSEGHDTFEANRLLGFPDDMRRFDLAADIFRQLGVRSVELLTNNPEKLAALEEAGILVRRAAPLSSPENPHNARYLSAKRALAGHLL